MRSWLTSLLLALSAAALTAAPASALAPCSNPLPAMHAVVSGQGQLESSIVDSAGRLYFTDATNGLLLRSDFPGQPPVVVASGIPGLGGLAFEPGEQTMLVGSGNSLQNGLLGILGLATVVRVDLTTGAKTTAATGLGMANGIARAPDGSIFGSNAAGIGIDKVAPGTNKAKRLWAVVPSANGLALDPSGQALYANQMLTPSVIKRIDLANPRSPKVWFRAPLLDAFSGLDGLAAAPDGRLFAAAWLAGQVWRIDGQGQGCLLAKGLTQPSSVAVGRGATGFSAGHIYVTTFSGAVVEIPAG